MSFLLCASLHAQKVTVAAQSEKVKGETVEGYGTALEGKKDAVSIAWVKFLKDIGKVRQSVDPMTITDPVFNGLTFSQGAIYSVVADKGENTQLWLGIKPGEWETSNVKRINNELEKAVYQFGVNYYRNKIQVQIDEAQQALDAVEKQKQRTANQTKDLTIQLSNNEQEKVQLDKSLEINKHENAALKVKLSNNMKAQDSLASAGIQIQKVKQMHVERQRKVK
jgi:predicted RNase H-like nuclease (RuvC/YqgF family)